MSSIHEGNSMPSGTLNGKPTGLEPKHKVSSAVFDFDQYGFAHYNGQVYERLSDKVGQIIKRSLNNGASPSPIDAVFKETVATKVAVPDNNSDMLKKLGTVLFNTILKEAVNSSTASGGTTMSLDSPTKSLATNVVAKAIENTATRRAGQLDNSFRFPSKINERLTTTGQMANERTAPRLALGDISNGTPSKYGVSSLMSMRTQARISEDKITVVHDFNRELEKPKRNISAYNPAKKAASKEYVASQRVNNNSQGKEQAVDEEPMFQDKPLAIASLPQSSGKIKEKPIATEKVVASLVEPAAKKEAMKVQPKVHAETPKPSVETTVSKGTQGESKPNLYDASSLTRPTNGVNRCQVCGASDHQIADCFWARKRR